MLPSDFEKAMLALVMWREDRSDGLQGMTAVGCVIRNRVRAGWYGGDWLSNIDKHNQFSSMTVLGDSQTIVYPDTRDPLFQSVLWKVDAIHEGTEPDLTDGALYYGNLSVANSPWFLENIVQKPEEHPRLGTVGKQTFFK